MEYRKFCQKNPTIMDGQPEPPLTYPPRNKGLLRETNTIQHAFIVGYFFGGGLGCQDVLLAAICHQPFDSSGFPNQHGHPATVENGILEVVQKKRF